MMDFTIMKPSDSAEISLENKKTRVYIKRRGELFLGDVRDEKEFWRQYDTQGNKIM
jgi:hypothetical protein